MRSILVVSSDAEKTERVKAALGAEGVWIAEVPDRTHAMRVVADQAPDLLVVDSAVDGAGDLVRDFSSALGGPGTLLLRRGAAAVGLERESAAADSVLDEPIGDERLAAEVRRLLAAPRQPAAESSEEDDRRLTAEEIFGDILREVESIDTGEWPPVLDPEPAPPVRTAVESSAPGPPPGELPTVAAADADADAEAEADADADAEPGEVVEVVAESAPAAESTALPPTVLPSPTTEATNRFGHYELGERIAVGGMAEIWEARMTSVEGFEKRVAIKKILPHLSDGGDFERMFVEEAKVAAGLSHENIIHIYDLGKVGDQFFIAMEYVEGHDLGAILTAARRRGERVPTGLAVLIGARLAGALDYAHRRPGAGGEVDAVVHRDVSPRNVLVGTDGRIKLCDFGVAKVASSVAPTQFGAIKGKIPYMSPEQAYGRSVDGRSDLFSLGVVLYEMATGKRLFAADSEISLLEAVRECQVRDPRELEPDLPDSFAEVVLRALAREPEERYATAGEMQRELESILYSLRPTPGADDLARYLEVIFAEPASGPEAASVGEVAPEDSETPPPLAAPAPAPAPDAEPVAEVEPIAVADEDPFGEAPPAAPRRAVRWALTALLVVVALAALAVYWLNRESAPVETPPLLAAPAPESAPVEAPATTAPEIAEEAPPEPDPAGAPAQPSAPQSGAGLEEIVNRQLAEKEAELRRVFQEQEADLRRQLEEMGEEPVVPEAPPADDSGGGSGLPPG